MSNRIYTARQNFVDGWALAAGRFTKPGAIGEIYNMQLDLEAEGALRQTWGLIPYAFWPSTVTTADGQFLVGTPTVEGRRQGIAGVDSIKVGDAGVEDSLIYTDMQDDGAGNTDAVFYWVAPVAEEHATWNFPFGTSISGIKGTLSQTLEFRIRDFIYMHGWGHYLDLPITMSAISATGFASTDGQTFTVNCKASASTDTYSIEFTNTYTAEIATFSFEIESVDADNTAGDVYSVCWEQWRDIHNTMAQTASIFSRSGSPHTYTNNFYAIGGPATWSAGAANMRNVYKNPITYHPCDAFTSLPLGGSYLEKDLWGKWAATSDPDLPGPVSLYGTCTHHVFFPVGPINGDTGDSSKSGWSSPLQEVNRVSSISQPRTGPLGIWKSATMNGKAYFYNGYSGTAFSLDIDDPTSVGVIGLERLDASAMTATESTIKENNSPPRGRYKYWVSYINEDGEESGLSTPAGGIGPVNIRNNYYSEVRSIPSGPATGTGIVYLYRSLNNDFSPFFLKRLKASQEGASPGDTLSYDDKIPDDELGDLPWAHGDLPPYDLFSPVVYYDRLWGLGTRPGVDGAARTTLFWSDINNPESWWWDGNWANVYGDDGDEVTALVRDKTGLLVFKNNHLYLMSGRTPEEISFVEITVEDSDTGVGCPHPNAVIATDFGVFFYWNKGVYRYLQGTVIRVSKQIDPLLGGKSPAWGVDTSADWEMLGNVYDWSVTMDYDAAEQVLYFGAKGNFPDIQISLEDSTYTTGMTFLLDAANARWMGLYTGHFGFFQRANVKLYPDWDPNYVPVTAQDYPKVENFLTAASMDEDNGGGYPGFSVHHPLACIPSCTHWGRWTPDHWVKFRPVAGNTGPYGVKRFTYVDYLLSEAGAQGVETSELYSAVYLDSSATQASTATIVLETGPVFSKLLQHTLGLVGSELEVACQLDPLGTGAIYRLYEYATGWQNLGRERAELPGAAPKSPPAASPKALR